MGSQAAPTSSTPLHDRIARLIDQAGPLTIAEYMHLCLSDPEHGYYQTRTVFGSRGDFVTAPEISQMFGELIGVWCVQVWQNLGKPSPFCLAELGPGNTTLMKDLLRASKIAPEFAKAAHIHLVETGKTMRNRQMEQLKDHTIVQLENIGELPDMPTLCIANEFLDAIPFRQYVKQKGQWHEVGVTLNENRSLNSCYLPSLLACELLPAGHQDQADGTVFEHSPAREAIVQSLASQLDKNTGAALVIDYGHKASGFGDTFQAVRDHHTVSPFEYPGLSDLTSHVDFSRMKQAIAAGLSFPANAPCPTASIGLTSQGAFLLAMGLLERAGSIGQGQSNKVQSEIQQDVERLASPTQMGELFKVLAFSNPRMQLPGFGDNPENM